MFWIKKNTKKCLTLYNPHTKVGFKGLYISRTCFPDEHAFDTVIETKTTARDRMASFDDALLLPSG